MGVRRYSSHTVARTMLHLRALLRVARRRPSLALGLAIAAGSALTATGTALSHHIELHTTVEPLAPPPAAPLPPILTAAKHHRLANELNEIGKINPLRGLASWYGDVWNGRTTASGETFDETKLTAAHMTLPLGTLVRVTDLNSKRSVVVKINDRGSFAPHRVIDLSSAAARELGIVEEGLARVKLEVIGKI
jgi:rare lipoprotein A